MPAGRIERPFQTGPGPAGIAALGLSINPDLDAKALQKILKNSAIPIPALAGKVACGGMVNACRALPAANARRQPDSPAMNPGNGPRR